MNSRKNGVWLSLYDVVVYCITYPYWMYTKCLSTLKCCGWAYGCILIAVLLVLCTDSYPPPWPVSVNTNRNFLRYLVFRYRYNCGYFWLYDLVGTAFEDFAGTLFLKIWREFLLSLKRRAKCTKGGRSPPPSFGKRGLQPILKYQIYQPSFPLVLYLVWKYQENTKGFIPKYRIYTTLRLT